MIDLIAQILATVLSVASGFFVRKPDRFHRLGCWLGLLSEPFYIYTFIFHQQWCMLLVAFCFGAIIGIILMAFDKKSLKSEIPFGPFLITGTFVALFWGGQIIQWYLNFFRV